MIDFCVTNSTPPSVFTFLVGKLHDFWLKDPVAKRGSQQKNVINYKFSVLKMTAQIKWNYFKNFSPTLPFILTKELYYVPNIQQSPSYLN